MLQEVQVAELCHEANRIYCQLLGDRTQPNWCQAPEWQKGSAMRGVRFHIENPKAGPQASHENWLREKESDGWKYGEVKDAVTKEHPCFLPYSELPVEQRVKDSIFLGIVNACRPLLTGEETELPESTEDDGPEPCRPDVDLDDDDNAQETADTSEMPTGDGAAKSNLQDNEETE